ncbi:probable mitochondrial glutathione transporter SLC25A40 isoform X1 [Lutzomyia longipalpis]|uniref:probable mitochondrial glutathione transporter SLC25A40 isoform X1 n=1 Tax=Lutzomyia longipalpis TaxID=7200 RepID=UPI0024835C8F|nr:probable mitochondrial glutathione transporter SLC25A40 isoform X1 [Lutzomyia longipalpis]
MDTRVSPAKHYDIDDPRFRIHPSQQMVSACSGALLTSLFMTPLDVVKTRLQAQQKMLLSNKCFLYCNGLMDHLCPCGTNGILKTTPHLNGTIDAFAKISQSEGIRALWSGLSPTLVLAVPTTVIYFVAYEQLRVHAKDKYTEFHPDCTGTPWWIAMGAGSLGRTIAATIVSPLELVRTKMQSQKLSYWEVGQALKSMVNTQGILGLWTGLRPTLFRDVPFSGIYWTSYESIKALCNVTGSPSFQFSFIGGAVSGSIAAIITTPFDVVKTHKQIELGEKLIYTGESTKKSFTATLCNGNVGFYAVDTPKKPKNESVFPALESIYRLHGIRGLFAGIIPRLVKVAPACAIMLSSFEYGKAFFHTYNVTQFQRTTPGN